MIITNDFIKVAYLCQRFSHCADALIEAVQPRRGDS